MFIKDILMELRSRLRSCNVYITTGMDFMQNFNLKISILANSIVLNYYRNEESNLKRHASISSIESLSDCYSEDDSDVTLTIPIKEFCEIIPNSMSCLKIDRNNISFRILTEPKNGGNFYKELLSTGSFDTSSSGNNLQINVKSGEELKFLCSNCSNTISENVVKFDRILELPSINLDMSEWFCHGHGNTSQNGVIKPSKTDFLHRLTYFVVDYSILSEKTNKFNMKRDIYHCNRCLAWLGIKSKESVKLFNSEIKLNQNFAEKSAFTSKSTLDNLHINDFIYTIECMTREFNLGFQYTVMCKIVLECLISSSTRQYLLIWVIDKDLQVLKGKKYILDDQIELQSSYLTKILYKIELTLNEEVETWLAAPGVVSTQISKLMFSKGLEHLQNMSLKVPEPFRQTNGYFVSYLNV